MDIDRAGLSDGTPVAPHRFRYGVPALAGQAIRRSQRLWIYICQLLKRTFCRSPLNGVTELLNAAPLKK